MSISDNSDYVRVGGPPKVETKPVIELHPGVNVDLQVEKWVLRFRV